MNLYWNSELENDPMFEVKQKLENITIEDNNFEIKRKIPKIFKKLYNSKRHSDLFNKKVKKPVTKNIFQESELSFSEQLKNMHNILDFQKKFGVSIQQKNGQRKLGPTLGCSEPQPGPGCEIFVGRIPRNIYEDVIYPIFRQVGNIYEMRLMMNFSGTNRGFCFIMYEKAEMAQRAIKELNNYQIRPGWFIGVVESVNNCRLHVLDLPPQTDIKILIKKLWPVCEDIDKVSVFTNIKNPMIKHALISFKTHRSAAMARRRLLPDRNNFFNKSDVRIEWAHPKISLTNVLEESGVCNNNNEVIITKTIKNDKKNFNEENSSKRICKSSRKRLIPINTNKPFSNLDMMTNIKNDYVLQFYDRFKYSIRSDESSPDIPTNSYNDNYKNVWTYSEAPPYYINTPAILNSTNCSVVQYPWLNDQYHWRKMMSSVQNEKDSNYVVPTFMNNDNFYNVENVRSVLARPILNSSS